MGRKILALVCWIGISGSDSAIAKVWTEDSFEDFASGELDGAGQNLYVSHDGKVRTIHRYDLNDDGFVDLIFNSTHDTVTYVPATAGVVLANGETRSDALAVQGSMQVELADLNRDGFLDAVFCPNGSGLQHPRRFLTVIYGGADGWPARRSQGMLPVWDAASVAIVDLNHDGWLDVAVLNGEAWRAEQPKGRIVRIFWGGERGLQLVRRLELGVAGAIGLVGDDFDGDGGRDLAVLESDGTVGVIWAKRGGEAVGDFAPVDVALPGKAGRYLTSADVDGDGRVDLVCGTGEAAIYFVNGKEGRAWGASRQATAFAASHVGVGDLDGDGWVDLALSNFGLGRAAGGEAAGAVGVEATVRVLWGGADGPSVERFTPLEVPYASATAVGDMNGDGRADLVVAVHQTETDFAAESVVFLGRGGRRFEKGVKGFATEGAVDVSIAPARGSISARAVFANSLKGKVGERLPLQVYWGGAKGFDAERFLEIPFRSGYEATSADFNLDGFVDLVAINSQHAGAVAQNDPTAGANVFWGGADGFDLERRRTVLRETFLGTSNAADLNRDGYLDLVLGAFDEAGEGAGTPVVIYYGSKDGFARKDRVAIACTGRSIGNLIADLDGDGWLDIAVVSTYEGVVRIFLGGADGFGAGRQRNLEMPYPISLETADLDRDGRLDLVVGSYYDPVAHHHDTGTMIFWGSAEGFREWNGQRLEGWAPVGPCVADFDGDGYLDLFTPNYLGEITREAVPSYLYWGGADGFSVGRRTRLVCDSAHDALAGDFDRDGKLDLAVSCHTKNGSHYTDSLVFYNDGKRFVDAKVQRLPTHGSHWMWGQDMGNIADRKWRQTYTSSVFQIDGEAKGGRLTYRAEVPDGTRLHFMVRSAAGKAGLGAEAWRTVREGDFSLAIGNRCLQYRAVFESGNGDRYPVLDRVTIETE